jgi:hypothetical protein
MNFPWGKAQVPGEKGTFPKEPYMFSRERPKLIEKTYVLKLFAIKNVSCLFLYSFETYHWKDFKESYNFVVANISIIIHMQKL